LNQKKINKVMLIILPLFFTLSGCTMSNLPAQIDYLRNILPQTREFILLGADQYEGEFTAVLASEKIKVKPIAFRQKVTEIDSPGRIVEYREAGYRYAIKLDMFHDYLYRCVFGGGHMVNVTMSIIDISQNENILIIRQKGPDRECPPLDPVWVLLARELAKALGSGNVPPPPTSPR
jgi:hypothetical protein